LDPKGLGRIVGALAGEEHAEELTKRCEALTRDIRAIPPELGEKEIARRLGELVSRPFEWAKNDDEQLVRNLRQMANEVDRMRRLKSGGVAAFSDQSELKARIEKVIDDCKHAGLFLVPVGELECWSREMMSDGPSRERKAEWVNEFVKRMREHPDAASDILKFASELDRFHESEAERLAGIDLSAPEPGWAT